LSKQLNVMQTTHLQQSDHILNLNERHTKQYVDVARKSNAECEVYVTDLFWQGWDDNK